MPQTDAGYYAIESLFSINAISSVACPSGSPSGSKCYKPTTTVLRKEFAKALVLAAGQTELKPATKTFSDVDKSNPYFGFIERAADPASWGGKAPLLPCKVTSTSKSFCPATAIIRSDTANSLVWGSGMPALNPLPATATFSDVAKTTTFWANVETLNCKGIMGGKSSTSFGPSGTITRREMANFLAKTFMVQNVQGYTKQQNADNSLNYIGNMGILVDGKLWGVSAANGYYAIPYYLTKGTHILKGQSSSTLVPFNVSSANVGYGWQYINRANNACLPTWGTWVGDIKMAAPVKISGTVIDGDSNDLLTGLPVTALTKDASGNQINSVQATTDTNGNFTISGASPGNITVTATKANFTMQPLALNAQIGQTLADQEINLVPNANFIEGDIKTDTGDPLSAAVKVNSGASFYGRDMTFATDFTGHYKAFGIKPGATTTLTISSADFLDQKKSITSPTTTRQTTAFDFTFVSSMVDTRTGGYTTPTSQCAKDTSGNIIKDAYVVLSNGGTYSGGDYPEQKYYLKTDANGCLTLNNIPAGMYGVTIFKDNTDGTTTYYAFPGDEQQITIDHNQVTSFPLNGLRVVTP